jgi:hypothetical protein
MGIPKVDEATTHALELIRDAAPGLLTMTEVAEEVARRVDVSVGTARSRVRAAVEAGGLLELKPWSRKFFIELPGEKAAGVGPFYIAQEWIGASRENRKVITTDDSKMRPSSYGPGSTTYVADPEQVREYVHRLADEKKAEAEKERQDRKDREKAERKEISRRFPGLSRTLRKVTFLGRNVHEFRGRTEIMEGDSRLSSHGLEDKDITEHHVHLDVRAWGDENVAILKSILEAGIAAHIQAQPLVHCKHDGRRILRTTYGSDEFWWHIDTTNASCGKDTDTNAEPAKEG